MEARGGGERYEDAANNKLSWAIEGRGQKWKGNMAIRSSKRPPGS